VVASVFQQMHYLKMDGWEWGIGGDRDREGSDGNLAVNASIWLHFVPVALEVAVALPGCSVV